MNLPRIVSRAFLLCGFATAALQAQDNPFVAIGRDYAGEVRPLLARYCLDCHSTEAKEGELDLERFATLDDARADAAPWQSVARMLDDGEMPPKDSDQPTAGEASRLRTWVDRFLDAEARSQAGDPGPVTLRRLNNAEYAYTLRDLTGVASLDPAREFPVDSAAGEGFTNTGQSLVMSPGLLTKYLDAAKQVADHAVLLPDGIRFSPSASRSDWNNEALAGIRDIYRRHSVPMQSAQINLQGLVWESADGGKLPLASYLEATIAERDALASGAKSIPTVASARGLNAKYLTTLWSELNSDVPSPVLDEVRARWRAARPEEAPVLVAMIEAWQQALWKFNRVGHLGRVGGPTSWMEGTNPLSSRVEVRVPLMLAPGASEIPLHLSAGGDAAIVWERPRFVSDGRPDLPLRDVRATAARFAAMRERLFASATPAFAAIDEALTTEAPLDREALAAKHGVDEATLARWFEVLGVRDDETAIVGLVERRLPVEGYPFVRGWGKPQTPNFVANASDQEVRIPGRLLGRSVAIHPSPELDAVIAWRSPVDSTMKIAGRVVDAHTDCGNGVTWRLEWRRGSHRLPLASGATVAGDEAPVGPIERVDVRTGDVVALVIGARDRSHVCDLTRVDLTIRDVADDARTWDLSDDLAGDREAGNPQSDRFGSAGVWHLCEEPANGETLAPTANDDLLSQWLLATNPEERLRFRTALAGLLTGGPDGSTADSDRKLYDRLTSWSGPLAAIARRENAEIDANERAPWGLPAEAFGKGPNGEAIDAESLFHRPPGTIVAKLAPGLAGYDFVASVVLHPASPDDASALPSASLEPNANEALRPDRATLVRVGSEASARMTRAFDDFRALFPAALCYSRIVPIDEVVTLRLVHREDEPLRRLLLTDAETAELDRLWDELHFVGQDALVQVDAFEQLMEYASQDADPSVFAPLREPIRAAAEEFRRRLVDAEPAQLDAALDLADRAWRRPLTHDERAELRELYERLRAEELSHDAALRMLIARVLTAPAFLYRLEMPPAGLAAAPVSHHELATRLSYFLWSSAPDAALRAAADRGELSNPDALREQALRMLGDERIERLASEFACQWLHVRDFETYDEKSEIAFPEFAAVQADLGEEPIRFFNDLFQNDRPVLSILESDAAFLNANLARHYGVPWPADTTADEWRRVEGVREFGRGGALGMGAMLSKQSGASRTSPVLRGTWVGETLLGERLPRPPKDVPPLPEEVPVGLTERELVERHVSDASCARCHVRIDPFGFALERYDAIGRQRDNYAEGKPVDTRTQLADGTAFDGLDGLRDYLANVRRDDFLRQFCRKLLGYALGRGVRLSDEPLLETMVARLDEGDGRVSFAIEAIVLSDQFRQIRGADRVERTPP